MQIDRPITIAIIIFAILLLVFFLVFPEYRAFNELRTELAEKKAEFNAQYDYYAGVVKVYDELNVHQEDIKKIDDALPLNPELGRIVYYLEQTAVENGLTVKNLFLSKSSSSVAAKNTNSVKEIVFSMDLMGGYPALGSFLVSLEKSSRIFEVSGISFGGNVVSSQSSQSQIQSQQTQIQQSYTFNLQIKTFSY